MKPYLVRPNAKNATLNTTVQQTIPANGGSTMSHDKSAPGYTMRGTFEKISNAEAHSIGALQSSSSLLRYSSSSASHQPPHLSQVRGKPLQAVGDQAIPVTTMTGMTKKE